VRKPVSTHRVLLVGKDHQIAAWTSGAQQKKSCCPVLRKIEVGTILIEFTMRGETSRAGEASPLSADRRQGNAMLGRDIPDRFAFGDPQHMLGFRKPQCHQEYAIFRLIHRQSACLKSSAHAQRSTQS